MQVQLFSSSHHCWSHNCHHWHSGGSHWTHHYICHAQDEVKPLVVFYTLLHISFISRSKPLSDSNQGLYVSTDNNPAYGVSKPSSDSNQGLYVSTDNNPAYGVSKPSSDSNQAVYVSTDNNPAYGVTQSSRPAPHSGPDTGIYEMIDVDTKDTHI